MSFRPVIASNSLGSNFNNLNDYMRNTDGQFAFYRKKFDTGNLKTAVLNKTASATGGTTTIPHGLPFTPLLVFSIENTTNAPGDLVSGNYANFDITSGILNGLVYMSADTVNIYLKANTPSGGSLYAQAITFTAKYWVLQSG